MTLLPRVVYLLYKRSTNYPVGIATTPIPTKEIMDAKTFPHTVIGITSPYPTVASETVAHQMDAVILEKTSGCASFSKNKLRMQKTK